MLTYNPRLKKPARALRNQQTESEQILWLRLRRKQLHGVQFYRQRPIGEHIVDFFAPRAKLVIEVDGSQHFQADQVASDRKRDALLSARGLLVLRFNSHETIVRTESVLEVISSTLLRRLTQEIPPHPPLPKGGSGTSGVARNT